MPVLHWYITINILAFKSIEKALLDMKPDIIITMGCKDKCPYVSGAVTKDWELPDPAGKSMDVMRNVRDEIEKKVKALVNNPLS